MTFAAPLLLAGLALLVPVLVAFLVRRRRDVVRVPSTLLYRLAGAPSAQNRRIRNLRRLASLIVCLLAVGALVLAAARPSGRSRGETVALVVDVSASMDAGSLDPPLARARRFAARRIARGGPDDRYAIIAAGSAPVRLAGPVAPGAELDDALRRIRPERGRADVPAAIELASSLVAGAPGARIVLLGDGEETLGDPSLAGDVPVTQRMFPPRSRDNLGISALATRPAAAREDEREVLVTIATSSDRDRAARVTITAEGRTIADRRIDVPARGEAEVRARVLAGAARLDARVEPADGLGDVLGSDDAATLLGAARPKPRVLLVATPEEAEGPAAFFVEKALVSAGVGEIVRATPALEGVSPEPLDVLVALGTGPARRVDLPALYVGSRAGALPLADFRDLTGGDARLRSLEGRDPILRGVALDGVTIEHATAAAVPPGARALVDLDGGTVVLAGGAGRSAFVYVGVDPARSDLALRVAFPVLVANALHALGGAADVISADTVARSEITLAPATDPPGAEEVEPRFRLPFTPAMLLGLLGAALLALEAWTWRKGWANG